MNLDELCMLAKRAAVKLNRTEEKILNDTLLTVASDLKKKSADIIRENQTDMRIAREKGCSEGMLDRLFLDKSRVCAMADGIEQIVALKSPSNEIIYSHTGQDGIKIKKIRVPFGVIGIIYESRPNVTADAFALCFKTGNAVVLKGGSDAICSNKEIVKIIRESLKKCGIDEHSASLIEDTSRETTLAFMKENKYVDLLIPRGSASLIKTVVENSTVPVIETGAGNCHVYVDEFADIEMAKEVVFNAKTQRYGVCNACESLVIHSRIINKALPEIAEKLAEKNVEIRGDERALTAYPKAVAANEDDFYKEYLGAVISVKTVDSIEEAIEHINRHSTGHSEAIITENKKNAEQFLRDVDSAAVYVNASTRFTDGFEFGLGAEIGISTQKLHARGPMGLAALTTTKFLITGNGTKRK